MENHHSSPTNNDNISKEDLINANHTNELPIKEVFSNNNSNGSCMIEFPPGFRFFPTDVELITHYLKRKLDNLPLQPNKIYEMNIYKYNPETIAAHVKPTTEEKVWYIFTPRDRKYRKGNRPNRSAGDGYWKATGADRKVMDHNKNLIGFKRALVFHIGKSPKGKKTDWLMHEYRVPENQNFAERDADDWKLDDWVLCMIYKKSERDNTMFTNRKRSRDDEGLDTYDEKVHESSNENLSSHELPNTFSEAASQDSSRHDPTNCIDNTLCNHNNHATTFNHQVPTTFSSFPQSFNVPTVCDMPWSTNSAYNYQSCVPLFNGGLLHEGSTSLTADRNHQRATSPKMVEPISSARATTSTSIGHTEFGVPFSGSFIGGGYTGQECYGECLGHEKLCSSSVQDDPLDWVDQYLVNCEMDNSTINLPEYNTNNFVNGESSQSKGGC